MIRKLLNVQIAFSALITIAFAYGTYEALSYDFLAKIFPLYVSAFLFVVACVNLVLEIRAALSGVETTCTSSGDLATEWDIPMSEVWKRLGFYMGIILVVYLGIWVIGYPLSITLFIILFYRYIARARWLWSVVAGLAGFGFLALAFRVMDMDWPQGLIHLPWPLG